MLVAIGALLGIPLWILLGWMVAGVWHRHETKSLPGIFKTKVRLVSGEYRHIDQNFPRTAEQAFWVHDVLILEKGLLIPRTLSFGIADRVQPTRQADPEQVKGLGDAPVWLQVRLDNGAVLEIAAQREKAELASGPFFSKKGNKTPAENSK